MTFVDRPRVVILGIGFGGNIGSARPFVLLRRQLTEREKRMTDELNQAELVLLWLLSLQYRNWVVRRAAWDLKNFPIQRVT
jgi:hypothetical protein